MPPVATLRCVVSIMADSAHPWWVIGSSAVAAHGAATTVEDIDVLFDMRDAEAVRRGGVTLSPGTADTRFHSTLFARCTAARFPVDFMADLYVAGARGWSPLQPMSREIRRLNGVPLPVPNREELIGILMRFGRAKDHARAALLIA